MAKPSMNLTVRVSGALQEFIAEEVSSGDYENVSEYVRSLVRAEKQRKEEAAFQKLKAKLGIAFAAQEDRFAGCSVEDVIARGLARQSSHQS